MFDPRIDEDVFGLIVVRKNILRVQPYRLFKLKKHNKNVDIKQMSFHWSTCHVEFD